MIRDRQPESSATHLPFSSLQAELSGSFDLPSQSVSWGSSVPGSGSLPLSHLSHQRVAIGSQSKCGPGSYEECPQGPRAAWTGIPAAVSSSTALGTGFL